MFTGIIINMEVNFSFDLHQTWCSQVKRPLAYIGNPRKRTYDDYLFCTYLIETATRNSGEFN